MLLKYSSGTEIGILDAVNISLTGIFVVMIMLAVLAILVVLLSKGIQAFEKSAKKDKPKEAVFGKPDEPVVQPVALPESASKGELELVNTDEKTAAVIMAIVSDESKIPLNRLKFNSIKLKESEEK